MIVPEKQIKNKKDITLDNQLLNKYFAHVLTNI